MPSKNSKRGLTETETIQRLYHTDRTTAENLKFKAVSARAKGMTVPNDLESIPVDATGQSDIGKSRKAKDRTKTIRVIPDGDPGMRLGGKRSYALPGGSAVRIVRKGDAGEEYRHILNPVKNEGSNSDTAKAASVSGNASVPSDSPEHYYALGNRTERVGAMGGVKELVARMTGEPLEVTGSGMVDLFGIPEAERGRYYDAVKEMYGSEEAARPLRGILDAGFRIHDKKAKGEQLTPSEAEADRDLSDAGLWDKVVMNGHSAETMAGAKVTGIPEAEYRWLKKGVAIDPGNIKGTGIAFTAVDRIPIPKGREKEYEAYLDRIAALPEDQSHLVPKDWRSNLEFAKDYDFRAAFLAGAKPVLSPVDGKYHISDVGKLPNHPTFSKESMYAKDPRWAPLAGSWDGNGYVPGDAERAVHEDAVGGDAGDGAVEEPAPEGAPAQERGGPRIVINPAVFHDKRDALCVAMNEAFRVLMEELEFEPMSEPTEKQRRFFSDTAYADDEVQLKRTILARICTFDTSVTDPTDEQLEEAVEFLEMVMKAGAPQNEWEQRAVQRIHDVIVKALESGRANGSVRESERPEAPVDENGTTQGDVGGGTAGDPRSWWKEVDSKTFRENMGLKGITGEGTWDGDNRIIFDDPNDPNRQLSIVFSTTEHAGGNNDESFDSVDIQSRTAHIEDVRDDFSEDGVAHVKTWDDWSSDASTEKKDDGTTVYHEYTLFSDNYKDGEHRTSWRSSGLHTVGTQKKGEDKQYEFLDVDLTGQGGKDNANGSPVPEQPQQPEQPQPEQPGGDQLLSPEGLKFTQVGDRRSYTYEGHSISNKEAEGIKAKYTEEHTAWEKEQKAARDPTVKGVNEVAEGRWGRQVAEALAQIGKPVSEFAVVKDTPEARRLEKSGELQESLGRKFTAERERIDAAREREEEDL